MEQVAVWLSGQLDRDVNPRQVSLAAKSPTRSVSGYRIIRSNTPLGYSKNFDDKS